MYDLIVIGGGPAGGDASTLATKAGLKTILIERAHLGGVCLNEGCIPSKTLLNCAKRYGHARHSEAYGVKTTGVSFDIRAAMQRKEKIIAALRRGSEGSKKRLSIPVVKESATILPPAEGLFRVAAGEQTLQGKRLLLCTGSQAIRPPIPGADQPFVLTNRELLSIDHIPEKLVIIGGGVIGLEFATFFSETGSSVTVVEMLPDIAAMLDADIRAALRKGLEKNGVTFHMECRVTAIGNHCVTFTDKNATAVTIPADTVLMSVGRRPDTDHLGLENLHVHCERGAVVTDERCRTNIPDVWAAGDINGKVMLAHTASREAQVAVNDMLGKAARVNYDTIPNVIYTHPEVATVGLTLEQARAKGYDAVESTIPMTYNGRYLAETEGERGVVKAVAQRSCGTVLGVHLYGGECSEMIHAATIIIENELRIRDVEDIVFAHPTVAEIIKDAIVDIKQ